MESGLPIRAWAEDDRPREKFLLKGRNAVSDTELLAILLRTGMKGCSALDLARELLHKGESLDRLARMSAEEMKKLVKGLGDTKAVTLLAALELGRRRKPESARSGLTIKSSQDAFSLIGPALEDLPHEEFHAMALSRANKVLGRKVISSGGINGTVADIRMILRYALDHQASGLIVAHNHPSGNLEPSQADVTLTKKLNDACKLFEINLLDHLIIGHNQYASLADKGLL
jgi:DNA repair protein RadC